MKHKKGLGIVVAVFVLGLFLIPMIYSFFHSTATNEALIGSGQLGVEISKIRVEQEGKEVEDITSNQIVDVMFTLENSGTIDLNYTGTITMNWQEELSEKGNLLVFPSSMSDEEIMNEILSDDDSNALVGLSADDSITIETSLGEKQGIVFVFEDNVAELKHETTKDYHFRLLFLDSDNIQNNIEQYDKKQIEYNLHVDAYQGSTGRGWSDRAHKMWMLKSDVIEKDKEPPVVTIVGDNPMEVKLGDAYNEFGAIAYDNVDGDLEVSISGEVLIQQLGTYYITYTATDSAGNSISEIRVVHVVRKSKPIITPIKNDREFFIRDELDLKTLVTINDPSDPVVSKRLEVTPSVDYSSTTPGNYQVVYNVTNAFGVSADPVVVNVTIFNFTKVEIGYYHSLGLTSHGKVYSWGYNDVGQLGHGTMNAGDGLPVRVNALNSLNIVDVGVGFSGSYALSDTGEVYSWGYGVYGQLGHGNVNNLSTPTKIGTLNGIMIKEISVKFHTVFALTNEGEAYAWGYGTEGQLGNGANVAINSSPIKMGLGNIKSIHAGWFHQFAITNDDSVYAWGTNQYGEMGDGTVAGSLTPKDVTAKLMQATGSVKVKDIGVGYENTYLLDNNGRVYAWGYGGEGRLGHGNATTQYNPKLVQRFVDLGINVTTISAGINYAIVSEEKGAYYAWGYNDYGKLGMGNTAILYTPTLSNYQTGNITNVSANYVSTAYIDSAGYLYGFGYNANGQNGAGGAGTNDKPVRIIMNDD